MSDTQNARDRSVLRPSRTTLFFRTFLPYQVYRFAWINLRMLTMIAKSHPRSGESAK